MSLPDAPNTLREKYYSVMAGQNDADILPDIETAPSTENRYLDYIARNGGGGSGDVTKDYVDEQDAKKTDKVTSAISGNFAGLDSNGNLTDSGKTATDFATASDMSDVQGVIPSTATTQNKLATAADTAGEEIASTATGTSITLTDGADGYLQGVTVKGKSRKTKNLLEITATTQTVNGVTFTVNSDGTVKVNGTASDEIYFKLTAALGTFLIAGSYHLSGCPQNGSATTYMIYDGTQNDNWNDTGNGVDVTYTDSLSSKYIYIKIMPGVTLNNQIFKPMICTSADYAADPTFEPYFEGIKSIGDAGWGVVDLGTLEWEYNSEIQAFNGEISNIKINSNNDIIALCAVYNSVASYTELIATNKTTWINNTQHKIVIRDTSYTDATAFKSAMSGVLLYYPLADTTGATPIFGITSKNGEGQGTAATITTGLPLRSTTDGTVYDELTNEKVITRCEVVEGEVVPLATPTETPLTSAEKSALASLRTYDHTTHIDATDAPTMTVDYLLNTNNGKAVAGVDNKIVAIKSVSWTGTGTATNSITFPEKPTLVLSIQITNKDPLNAACMPFRYGNPSMFCTYTDIQAPSSWRGTYTSRLTYSADELTMTITGTDKGSAWNDETTNYTLYYM